MAKKLEDLDYYLAHWKDYRPMAIQFPVELADKIKVADEKFEYFSRRVAARSEHKLQKVLKKKGALTSEEIDEVINERAIYYEELVRIGNARMLVVSLPQLFARVECAEVEALYVEMAKREIPIQERNDLATAIAMDAVNAALLKSWPQGDRTPGYVAILLNATTNPVVLKKVPNVRLGQVEDPEKQKVPGRCTKCGKFYKYVCKCEVN